MTAHSLLLIARSTCVSLSSPTPSPMQSTWQWPVKEVVPPRWSSLTSASARRGLSSRCPLSSHLEICLLLRVTALL